MALITCPECGKQISDRSPACIHCGIPMDEIRLILSEMQPEPKNTGKVSNNNHVENIPNINWALEKKIINCLNCGIQYTASDSGCPKCGFPYLTLSRDSEKIRKNNTGKNMYKASIGSQKEKQLRCIICSNQYKSLDLKCPKCKYPAFFLNRNAEKYGKILDAFKTDNGYAKPKEEVKSAQNKEDVAAIRAKAIEGDTLAMMKLGDLYANGKGVTRSMQEAEYWYRRARKNNANSAINKNNKQNVLKASEEVRSDQKETDVAAIRAKAIKGDSLAMLQLGDLYANGKGVTRSTEEAENWYRRASKNNAEAAIKMGDRYYENKSYLNSLNRAIDYYKQAVDLGSIAAKEKYRKACREREETGPAQLIERGDHCFEWRSISGNADLALSYYKQAADLGSAIGKEKYQKTLKYIENKNNSLNQRK